MASRGGFGFKSGKAPERDEKKGKPSPSLARAPSIASAAPASSRIPQQPSSFFFRSKQAKAKPEAIPRPSHVPIGLPESHGRSVVSIQGGRQDPTPATEMDVPSKSSTPVSAGKTTVQTKSGKARNVLRRKAPSIERHPGYPRTESSASSYEPTPSRTAVETTSAHSRGLDSEPRSILGVLAPSTTPASQPKGGLGLGAEFATSSSHMANFNARRNVQPPPTTSGPPPTPSYVHDSGSSTRHSESPGGFSRTSTPTSMSSQSPSIPTPAKPPVRARTNSPSKSRPPVTRSKFSDRWMQYEDTTTPRNTGLTAVRESGTSSSSSSTVKPESRAGSRKAAHVELSPQRSLSPSGSIPVSAKDGASPQEFSLRRTSLRVTPQDRIRAPPPRPSRDGVPQLEVNTEAPLSMRAKLQPSAPIHDSRTRTSSDADQSDVEAAMSAGTSTSNRMGGSNISRSPSLKSPHSAQVSLASAKSAHAVARSTSSAAKSRPSPSVEVNPPTTRLTKEPSPQRAQPTKSSRFGFFSRRAKSPMEPAASEKASKKGPTAGTGHEGYGKYGRRGRSGSVTTNSSRGRSTSSGGLNRMPSSRKSSVTSPEESALDDFYRDRLAPKTISGGGQSSDNEAELYMSPSAQSSVGTLDSSRRPSQASQTSRQAYEPLHKLHHVTQRLPQRDEDHADEAAHHETGRPSLAHRRSLHRSQQFEGAEPLRIPSPINTQAQAAASIDSRDTFQSSVPQSETTIPLTDDISEGREGNWLKSSKSEKGKGSSRRWKLFHRGPSSPKKRNAPTTPLSADTTKTRELPATITRMPETRPLPFYAMMDSSEQESVDLLSLQPLSRSNSQAVASAAPSVPVSRDQSPVRAPANVSMLLPSPPSLSSEFPPSESSVKASEPAVPPMAPVIDAPEQAPPAEIQEPRKPRLQQVGRIPRVVSKRDRLHRPPPQSFSRPRPYLHSQDPSPVSAPQSSQHNLLPETDRPVLGIQTDILPQKPWLEPGSSKAASAPLPEPEAANQKDEFLSFPPRIASQGSSSSGTFTATTTAVVPGPGAAPNEDEVWNEYNEFLDTVGSHASSPAVKGLAKPRHRRRDSSSKSTSPEKKAGLFFPPATAAPSRGLPSPPSRTKGAEAAPPTPGTISDLLAGYLQRGSTNLKHRSRSTTSRYSTSSIESEADSLAGQEAQMHQGFCRREVTAAQRLSQIYLRRDALLASRWLSFDRVLFSPAHLQVQSNLKDRVLVLDGLGNDEWSYYCAENYPTAMIYNLSPTERLSDPSASADIPGVPQPPSNHKHINHASLGKPFPFPQGFFSAAVFRFPNATSDTAYLNAVGEFKRVLRPGGYLELSMLDMELVNMGNLARRALRKVKERIHAADPHVSLKPLSDNIQKMLVSKGFANLNRCTLDVPVAGHVNSSRAESFDAGSGKALHPHPPRGERASGTVAKNLARVGRWWFSSCYEHAAGVSHPSVWNDGSLLAECEARETGFKLLLCYAQVPNSRRTRSF